MFQNFGVDEKIKYGTFNSLCEDLINQRGSLRNIVSNLISGEKHDFDKQKSIPANRILLIDEVDVFFSESFYGGAYHPLAVLTHEHINVFMHYLWNEKKRKGAIRLRFSHVVSSPEYLAVCKRFIGWSDTLNGFLRIILNELYDDSPYQVTLKENEEGENEIVYKDTAGDDTSARIIEGYKTMFMYFKEWEKDNVTLKMLDSKIFFFVDIGLYSYAELPKLYSFIMGATGTLATLSPMQKNELKDVYGIRRETYMPSVYPSGDFRFAGDSPDDVKLVPRDEFNKVLSNEITLRLKGKDRDSSKLQTDKRAVLVFFESKDALEKFYNSDEFKATGYKSKAGKMNEDTRAAHKNKYISHAASAGNVTLLTKE